MLGDQGLNLIQYGIVQDFIKNINLADNIFVTSLVIILTIFWSFVPYYYKHRLTEEIVSFIESKPSIIMFEIDESAEENYSLNVQALLEYIRKQGYIRKTREIEADRKFGDLEKKNKTIFQVDQYERFIVNDSLKIYGQVWTISRKNQFRAKNGRDGVEIKRTTIFPQEHFWKSELKKTYLNMNLSNNF